MVQSKGDVARLYKDRFEDITRATSCTDKNSDNIMKALKDRLDHEVDRTDYRRVIRDEAEQERREMENKLRAKEHEAERDERGLNRVRKRLEDEEKRRQQSDSGLNEKDKRIEFLESETDRLRDDRNKHKAYCQQLHEEL